MKNKCLLLLLFASFPIFSWADETLDSLLHVLDQTILDMTLMWYSANRGYGI